MNIKTIFPDKHKFYSLLFMVAVFIGSTSLAVGQQGNPPERDVWFFFFNNGGQAMGWALPCTADDFDEDWNNVSCTEDKREEVYLTIEVDNPATPQNPDWVGDTKNTMPDFNAFNISTGAFLVQGGWSVTVSGYDPEGSFVSRTLVVHDLLVDSDDLLVYGHASLGAWNNEVCVELEQCWNWPCAPVEEDGFWSVDLAAECIPSLDENNEPIPFPATGIVPHQWDAIGNSTDYHWSVPESGAKSVRCEGFHSPLSNYPVKVKKNRVLPLRAQLYDAIGSLITDVNVASPPVINIGFDSADSEGIVDVTDDALTPGQGDDGNQFVYTGAGIWRFNLKTKNYSAPGTYTITLKSGDDDEYQIWFVSTCITQFAIE